MTKVLMITNRFIYGGIEKLLLDIFEKKNNPEIQYDLLTLVSEKNDELIQRIKKCGVGYHTLALDKHNIIKRQFYHYKALYRFIKAGQYDVVHINITSYARVLDMMVVKKAEVRTRIIHSHSAAERDPFHRKLIRPLRKLYDYTATDFFACSDEAAAHLFSRRVFREKRYKVINNGIDINKYTFSEVERLKSRNELGIGKDEVVVGHVGRFTEAKNHMFILEIFKELLQIRPNCRLLLVGDGEQRNRIESKVCELKLKEKVITTGASDRISSFLSAMDIFLFPSVWEGLGISVVEAQCNGLPCYISENVPNRAVITSNVQQYSISEGAKQWAKKITISRNERKEEQSKIRSAGYDIMQTIYELEKIYMGSNVYDEV